MEKDKIFFGENGLTSTSANHIANMAKEAYKTLENKLATAVFYTTEIGILGSVSTNTLKEGVNDTFLDNLYSDLMSIAELKSLIAWLREAIKAKERLISEAQKLSNSDIADTLGITLPEVPESYTRLTSDDVIASWGIKQRNRYYYLDTVCSTIGKYIHPDMGFANAKENLLEVLSEKHQAKGSGRDTVIYTRTPTVSIDKVEETFFTIQDKYRGFQAELNSMKHSIEIALQDDDREKSQKEADDAARYRNECNEIIAKISVYKKDTIKNMQSLKIVIPDSLKHIFEEISKMGK